jgi:hypothetical protein
MNTTQEINIEEIAEQTGVSRRWLESTIKNLKLSAMYAFVNGTECKIRGYVLHSDGRRAKTVARVFAKLEWLKKADDDYYLLTLFDYIEPQAFDMFEFWKGEDRERRCKHPVVAMSDLAPEQIKWVLEQEDTVFYSCRSWDVQHNRGTLGDLTGPFETLPELRASMTTEKAVLFSTRDLPQEVAKLEFEEKVQGSFKINLPWALVTFDILTEEESELISSDLIEAHKGPLRGRGIRDDRDLATPDWKSNLTGSIAGLLKQQTEIAELVRIYQKVNDGIFQYGGWIKFLADYRERLVAELRKEKDGTR